MSTPTPQRAVPQSTQDALTSLSAAAGNAAGTILDLRNQIKVNMTQEDVDSVNANIKAIADGLNAVSANPTQPPPPTPPAATKNKP